MQERDLIAIITITVLYNHNNNINNYYHNITFKLLKFKVNNILSIKYLSRHRNLFLIYDTFITVNDNRSLGW